MIINKKICALALSTSLATTALTGCSSSDKAGAKEAATAFLDIVKSGTTENIEKYATDEVTNGDFVRTFDSEHLIKQLKEGFDTLGIDSETNAKVDELCSKISGMVTGYEISKVSIDKKNTATAIVKVDTSFPVNIAGDDETTKKIEAAAESYHTEHEDEIKQMYKDMGEEAATEQLYSKRIAVAVDTYSQIISDAQPETYAIVLTLEKNTETDSWLVTKVETYDSSVNGKTETATDTATTSDKKETEEESEE